jgi:hypothetical protein
VTVNATLARPGEHHNADQVTWPMGMLLYLDKKLNDHEDAATTTSTNETRTPGSGTKRAFRTKSITSRKQDIAAGIFE